MNNLENKIKEKIKEHKPKSKTSVYAKKATVDVAMGLLWIIIVILLGATIYFIQNTSWRLIDSPRLFLPMIAGLPWELIIIATGLTLGLYYLTINFTTLYRNKSALVVALTISLFAGYFMTETSGINNFLSDTPPMRPIYQRHGQLIAPKRGPQVMGQILSIEDDMIKVKDISTNVWEVNISKDTRILTDIKKDNLVVIVGIKNNNSIDAYLIKSAGSRQHSPQTHMPQGRVRGQMKQLY